ncbi:hypothetical protein BE25_0079 [Staphylococcus phage vB_SepM_BE25]|nr:hypothetical protein BE25_0079 [Staphylococcus phage vB_SepM_BE25]
MNVLTHLLNHQHLNLCQVHHYTLLEDSQHLQLQV